MTNTIDEPNSIGRNIERIRRLKGIKQDTLASALGISRQLLSKIEQSETLDDERLEQVAKALGVTSETIKEFDESSAVNNIGNTFHEGSSLINFNFNPIEKIVQLYDEKIELYDALLQSEREKNSLLESMLKVQEIQPKKR